MAIKIHHGPNGSYKTSGAIQDDLIPAIKAGRYIITNIRGFTRERVFQVFPETPSSLEVLNLSLEDPDDFERMRTWFMWAPRGAFIIFDETQLLFLKSWRDKDLSQFDYPGGTAAAKAADRPMSWLDAWTRHRHFNWDIILTTPNISYIREDIRMTCEKAYLHSNLAVIGIKGRYKESQHAATDNKPPAAHTIVEIKKIKAETFKLYDSTATGTVTDTIAGKSIFRQPKVLLFMALPAFCFGSVFYDGGPSILMGNPVPPSVARSPAPVPAAHSLAAARPVAAPGAHAVDVLPGESGRSLDAVVSHPFSGASFFVKAALQSASGWRYLLEVRFPDGSFFTQTDRQLLAAGYSVVSLGDCAARVSHVQTGATSFAVCSTGAGRAAERLASERSGEAGTRDPVDSVFSSPAATADELTPRVTVINSGKPGHLW